MTKNIKDLNIEDKKALSDLLAAVLLILICIIAIFLISITINKIIKPSFSPLEDLFLQAGISKAISIEKVHYNNENKDLEVKLRKINNYEINLIEFIIESASGISAWYCNSDCENCEILRQGTKTYYIKQDEKSEKLTLKINSHVIETREVS